MPDAPRTIKLTNTDDLDLSTGNLQVIGGIDSIAQDVRLRLRLFKGEWFLDREAGVPYFQDVLVKAPDPNLLASVFRKALLETPGVTEVLELDLTRDATLRQLRVRFKVTTDEGLLSQTVTL